MRTTAPAAALLFCFALAGCGADNGEPNGRSARPADRQPEPARGAASLRPPACPAGVANCRRASGRILYVERVDPDGDGDAHFVLSSPQSITLPGITVVDVRRGLRPAPLPGPGDGLAAAGPVFPGSYGQRQIQAVAVRVRRSR